MRFPRHDLIFHLRHTSFFRPKLFSESRRPSEIIFRIPPAEIFSRIPPAEIFSRIPPAGRFFCSRIPPAVFFVKFFDIFEALLPCRSISGRRKDSPRHYQSLSSLCGCQLMISVGQKSRGHLATGAILWQSASGHPNTILKTR